VHHKTNACRIISAADLHLGKEAILETSGCRPFSVIVAFPELLQQSVLPKTGKDGQKNDQLSALWESLPPLLAEGGLFLAAFSSSEAERFDRKKPAGFSRLGNVKREGFRALAYQRINNK